ncbi:purine phosphoribosyltransferase family protein, partial [Pontiella sp.]
VRKPGKLPHTVHKQTYELEYGTDCVEIHSDAFKPGQRILIIDDVLATGGTVAATIALIQNNFDVEIIEADFLMELQFLHGREKLGDFPLFSLLDY